MHLTDLASSIPGVLLVDLVPGVLLVVAVLPRGRRLDGLPAAPGLSAGLVGVVGLAYHLAHVRFEAGTVLPLWVVIAAVAWWRVRREGKERGWGGTPPVRAATVVAVLGAGLVAGIVGVVAIGVTFNDRPVPLDGDAAIHATMARAIDTQRDVLPTIPDPAHQTSWVRTRSAFEAQTALVSELGGPPEARAMQPLALVAVMALPLGLALLVIRAHRWGSVAALTPLFGLTVPMPTYSVAFGELPMLVDSTLVASLTIVVFLAVRDGVTRSNLLFVALGAASIMAIHGAEFFTVLALGGPLIAGAVITRGMAGVRRVVILGFTAAVGAALVLALSRAPAVPPSVASPFDGPSRVAAVALLTPLHGVPIGDLVNVWLHQVFPSRLLAILLVVGLVMSLLRARFRWAACSCVGMFLVFIDAVGPGVLGRVWRAAFPWSVPDRLVAMQYWALPVLLAFGLVATVALVIDRLGLRARVPAVTAACGIALVVVVAGTVRDIDNYRTAVAASSRFTTADEEVMSRMATALPARATVLVDGPWDAGQWIGAMTSDVLFIGLLDIQNHPDDRRLVLLADACAHPREASTALRGVDAVFVGSDVSPGAGHPWRLDCVSSIPGLRMAVRANNPDGTAAALFTVDSAG